MPKNTQGGKKQRRGKNEGDRAKRDIVMKAPGEAYAVVVGAQGQNQMALRLEDMTPARGIIRGGLRKKQWINAGDIVRVQLREGYEEGTVDIVSKYTADEAKELVRIGEVPSAMVQGTSGKDDAASRAGATAVRFVQASGTDEAAAKEQQRQKDQGDPNARKKNVEIDMKALLMVASNGNGAMGNDDEDDDDEGPSFPQPQRRGEKQRWSKNNDTSSDDEEDEEDEEEEEEDEEDEEEEEEVEDVGQNAASGYDDSRSAAQQDWNSHHHHKKDVDYKQRNKRGTGKPGVAGAVGSGVKAADVEDI